MSSPRVRDSTPVSANTPPVANVIVQPEVAATVPDVPEDVPATTHVVRASASSPTTWDDHVSFFCPLV